MKKLYAIGSILALLWGIASMWRKRSKVGANTNKGSRTTVAGGRSPRTRAKGRAGTKARRQTQPSRRGRGPVKQPSRPETVPASVEV